MTMMTTTAITTITTTTTMMMILLLLLMMMIMMTTTIIIIIIIIIIALTGAIRDYLQSLHCAANCLQYVRTNIIDGIENTLKHKWKWARHTARMKDNRWTNHRTEWQLRKGKRSRGQPGRRWQDDIARREPSVPRKQRTEGNGRH